MDKISNLLSRLRLNYSKALALILLACFLLVSFSIKGYGASWDEPGIYNYASLDAQVYANLVSAKPYEYLIEWTDVLNYYGPAYWLVGDILSSSIQAFFPGLDRFDAWHIVNFAAFLLGAWCLFSLGKRFTSQRSAFLASLLYLTQPLLWGHGVMNPKDIPFTTFFLLSVLAGVKMVEELANPDSSHGRSLNLLRGRCRRILTGAAALVYLLFLADLAFGHFLTRTLLTPVIDQVNAVEFIFLALATGAILVYWLVLTSPRNRWIVLAGIVTGFTIAIRVLGGAALGLVALYAFWRLRYRALRPLYACIGVALIATFVLWPYLWSDPLGHFRNSLALVTKFPWLGAVRFEGADLTPVDLPWYYLPQLISIQLTLPALALAAAGLVMIVRSAIKHILDWGLASIPVAWFLLPVTGVILVHARLYDNFRQFLFVTPPLFLLAAIAIDGFLTRIRPVLWHVAFVIAILVPGIAAGIWLHPYEYVYYNALVGWTGSIERQYENDYWYTSVCETARYLSTIAGDGTRIGVNTDVVKILFVRCADKKFDVLVAQVDDSQIDVDYSVITTRYDDDIHYFQEMNVIKVIGRSKTEFTVIKKSAP